jgi:hypothetical protein
MQGFAVVDNPTFRDHHRRQAREPNDTYVDQLSADAQAMIDAVVGMGVGDRDRFAVGGHCTARSPRRPCSHTPTCSAPGSRAPARTTAR